MPAKRPAKKSFTPGARGPLNGVRVVDLSRLVAGNVLTLQLADFGAEVIKIEPPEGDTLRSWRVKGVETAWKVYSRNKKSVALDLRSDAGRTIVRELAKTAAILVESFRPGVMEDMGLSPAELHAINPKLVILRISGWGQDGRYRHKPGFGTLIEGYSGFASMNGFADREPVLPPMYLADCMAALNGYGAVMVALREVEMNGGKGQVLDLPLFDPLFSMLGPQAANHKLTGEVKVRTGSRSTNAAPRNVYQTKDGSWVCLSASTQGMAMRVLDKIGRPELKEDPRFATNIERVRNGVELDRIIGEFVGARDLDENLRYFDEAGVTIGPVYDISQIVQDDYVLERESLIEIEDADMGELPTHPVVPRMSGTPGALKSAAPTVGEHNEALLKPMLGAAEYDKLCASGAISDGKTAGKKKK
ncbi:CaiB/BaiF CoA transferase family protein [Reyranella sp.]|uniref:CaiB/BaiF CoA transferase family protein n=1 Tax=Reyranella sp. TaxID=1929291 RepID=UPI003BAA9E6A